MVLTYKTPFSYDLQKRTFEGKNDPSKNGNSLTSKYMPSYKWWLKIYYKEGNPSEDCYVTKQDAFNAYNEAKRKAGQIM